MKYFRQHAVSLAIGAAFVLFLVVSAVMAFEPGRAMGKQFASFLLHMVKILPCVFILVGLFDVWVKTETVERHLGHGSSWLSYIWAVLLAGTTVGGMHVALPLAHALHVKRARLGVVLTFLSCAAICRVPMTLFEASFMGWRFTGIRFLVSLPLVLLFSSLIGAGFEKRDYKLPETNN